MMGLFDRFFNGKAKEKALMALAAAPEPTATPKVEEPKKTPKEIATENKEPWIAVLNTHVNKVSLVVPDFSPVNTSELHLFSASAFSVGDSVEARSSTISSA